MNEHSESWQEQNDIYLSAALAWLRLRLARLAPPQPAIKEEAEPEADGGCSVFSRWKRDAGPAAKPTSLGTLQVVTHPERITAADVDEAALRLAEAAHGEPLSPLPLLQQRLALSDFECNVLLLAVAMELDPNLAALCAQVQGEGMPYPTIALALSLFDDPAWDVLSASRPLRYWRLIQIDQPAGQALTCSPLRADMRLVNYVKGLNDLDERLTTFLAPFDVDGSHDQLPLPPTQQSAVVQIINHLEIAMQDGHAPVIQLLGLDPFSKQLVAGHAAAGIGVRLYRLPLELLSIPADELETLARLWHRESFLQNGAGGWPLALYLDAHEVDGGGGEGAPQVTPAAAPLRRFLSYYGGIVLLDTREIRPGLGSPVLAVEVDKPTPIEQQAAWTAALADSESDSPALLAGQFNLNITTVHQIAGTAAATAATRNGRPLHQQLWDACLANTRPRLDLLAQRLDAKATWEDIVLPQGTLNLLRQISHQVAQRSAVYDGWGWRARMNRGLGISALFAGDSGTGKTMASEVIANELRLNLYRIDLSAVVSKYIGETEKNLRRLFDAAEDGGAILFFDEADALFGKRSEVKDSHDRYANIEINYLLQRMEAYCGLAILATNKKSFLDEAFLRRLRFIVDFPFPGVQERAQMWEKVFPAETEILDLDYDRLAQFSLTGGSIHNIALNAAFLAAHEVSAVSMSHVLTAARTEFRKLERPLRETDFAYER